MKRKGLKNKVRDNRVLFFSLLLLVGITVQGWGEERHSYNIQKLLKNLTSNSPEVQQDTLRILKMIKWKPTNKREEAILLIATKEWDKVVTIGEPSVEPLIAVLKNGLWITRKKAAESLGRIGDKRAVIPLIDALKDDDPDVKEDVVGALGKIGDERTIEPLIAILKDKNEDWFVRKKAIEVLGDIGEPAVKPLLVILQDEDIEIREKAVEALGRTGEPAVAILIILLRDEDWDIRMEAAEALGRIGKPAVKPLISLLKDKDWFISKKAADALSNIGEPAVDPLIIILEDDNLAVREKAVKALGKIGNKRAIGPLITLLGDDNPDIREKTAEALGRIGEPAVRPLITTLKDRYWYVRWGAAKALQKIDWKPANDTENALLLIAKKKWYEVAKIGLPAIKPLINNLKDPYWYIRWEAAKALERIGWKPDPEDDTERILFLIATNKWNELQKIGSPAVEPLILALQGWDIQEEAIETLGEIGDNRAVEPLTAILQNKDWHLREDAVEALKKISDKRAIPALVGVLNDWKIGGSAASVLNTLGWQPSTLEERIYLLVSERKAQELTTRWADTKKVLLRDVRSNKQRIVENAVFAFIGIGREDVIAELIDILNSEGTKTMAETFLNSGNKGLNEAAKKWVISHGYIINPGQGLAPIRWGEM